MKAIHLSNIVYHAKSGTRTIMACLGAILVCQIASLAQPSNKAPDYTVFLVGDAGEPEVGGSDNMKLLKNQLDLAGARSAIVFLGDNIYPKGMPPPGHKTRVEAEKSITGQIEIIKDYPGIKVVIPGNHD